MATATPPHPTSWQGDQHRVRIRPTHLDRATEPASVRPGSPWVALAVFGVAALAYGILGYQVTVTRHVVVFDALDRLTRAFQVWYDAPPKLAAIGFTFPPLTTLVFLPVAVIKPLATGLVALPVLSAMFAGLTIAMIERTLARCEVPGFLRIPLLVLFGLNPLFVFYAGNGMSEVVYLALLSITLYCVVCWYETSQPRYLFGAGFALSVLVLTRYGFILWALALMVLIGVALVRRRSHTLEIEGSLVAFASPALYAIVLWILFNTLIVGDPLGWITASGSTQAVNATGIFSGTSVAFDEILKRELQLLIAVYPLALVALPALLLTFVTRGDELALWLVSLLVLGAVIIGVHAALSNRESLLTLRDAMPMMLVALVGAAWAFRSAGGLRLFIWAAAAAALIVGLFTAWHGMKTYPFQSQEQAFVRAIDTGRDQEGTSSIGGFRVGISAESQAAAFIKRSVHGVHAILTDNAQTFGVILLSGRPQLFYDRIIKGDGPWRSVLASPFGRVSYLLVTNNPRSGDLIEARYPNLNSNDPTGFQVVFRDARYILVAVAARNPAAPPPAAATGSGRSTAAAGAAAAH